MKVRASLVAVFCCFVASMTNVGCGKKKDATKAATNPTVTLKGAAPATLSLGGQGTIDAGIMKFNVYNFAVSTSKACTSPIMVFTSTAGVQKDMLSGPTFGSGLLAAGTYPCVMIEMSKIIADAPATTSGGCTANTVEQDVVCGGGQPSTLINGSSVTCTSDATSDQHITLYISTGSAGGNGNNSLLAPTSETDTAHGLKLTNAFVVGAADTAGTLSVASKNFFQTDGKQCGSIAPTFSFN